MRQQNVITFDLFLRQRSIPWIWDSHISTICCLMGLKEINYSCLLVQMLAVKLDTDLEKTLHTKYICSSTKSTLLSLCVALVVDYDRFSWTLVLVSSWNFFCKQSILFYCLPAPLHPALFTLMWCEYIAKTAKMVCFFKLWSTKLNKQHQTIINVSIICISGLRGIWQVFFYGRSQHGQLYSSTIGFFLQICHYFKAVNN